MHADAPLPRFTRPATTTTVRVFASYTTVPHTTVANVVKHEQTHGLHWECGARCPPSVPLLSLQVPSSPLSFHMRARDCPCEWCCVSAGFQDPCSLAVLGGSLPDDHGDCPSDRGGSASPKTGWRSVRSKVVVVVVLRNKKTPTPCLWQAPASTQKTQRKTRPPIRRGARWRAEGGATGPGFTVKRPDGRYKPGSDGLSGRGVGSFISWSWFEGTNPRDRPSGRRWCRHHQETGGIWGNNGTPTYKGTPTHNTKPNPEVRKSGAVVKARPWARPCGPAWLRWCLKKVRLETHEGVLQETSESESAENPAVGKAA